MLIAVAALAMASPAAAQGVPSPVLPGSPPAQPPAMIEGTWATADGSEITIIACPQGYCGLISKIVVPEHIMKQYGGDLTAIGANYTDMMNKDPALRGRPIQGLQILRLSPTASPWRFDGEVYHPEHGNTYGGSVEVVDADRIKLKGCALYVICLEQEWARVIAPAPVLAKQ
ncbi:DUF2147 domain-containing protein [Devosia enhydra]|nr:DUF2147 domain-containing protein [Devosia enhydra]